MSANEWANVAAQLWWIWLALAIVIGGDITWARNERRAGE